MSVQILRAGSSALEPYTYTLCNSGAVCQLVYIKTIGILLCKLQLLALQLLNQPQHLCNSQLQSSKPAIHQDCFMKKTSHSKSYLELGWGKYSVLSFCLWSGQYCQHQTDPYCPPSHAITLYSYTLCMLHVLNASHQTHKENTIMHVLTSTHSNSTTPHHSLHPPPIHGQLLS